MGSMIPWLAFALAVQARAATAPQISTRASTGFGNSCVALGDLDDDGTPDFAVGVPNAPVDGRANGAVFVLCGARRTVLQEWHGEALRRGFGGGLRLAGDVDADGVQDVLVGYSAEARCEVRSGSDGALLLAFDRRWYEVFSLGDADRDGASDFLVHGSGFLECRSGRGGRLLAAPTFVEGGGRLFPVGDLDGDGLVDLVLAGETPSLLRSGLEPEQQLAQAMLYSAKLCKRLDELWPEPFLERSWPVTNRTRRLEFVSAAPAADLDGDGSPELLLALSWGEVGTLDALSLARGTSLFRITGKAGFGYVAGVAPDLDHDGHPDLLLAEAPEMFEVSLRAHSGVDGARLWRAHWPDSGMISGLNLALLEDRNEDGAAEILVVDADVRDPDPANRVGPLRLLDGPSGKVLWSLGAEVELPASDDEGSVGER